MRGLCAETGHFSGIVAHADGFDAVAFIDVPEHLVEGGATLAACRERLLPSGLPVASRRTRGRSSQAHASAFRVRSGLRGRLATAASA